MIEVRTTFTEQEKVTEIVISGTKDIKTRDYRVRVYTHYDILKVDEEELEHFQRF